MNLETHIILTDLLLMILPFLAVYFHIKRLINTTKKQDGYIDKQRLRIDELEYKVNHPLKFDVGDKAMYGNVVVIIDEINFVKSATNCFEWQVRCLTTTYPPYSIMVDGYYGLKPYKEETPITPQTPNLTPANNQTTYGTKGLEVKPPKLKPIKKKK